LVFASQETDSQKPFSATTKVPQTERIVMNPNAKKFSQLTFSDRYVNQSIKTGRDIFSAGTTFTARTDQSFMTNQQLEMI
jgi:hypothetical protein